MIFTQSTFNIVKTSILIFFIDFLISYIILKLTGAFSLFGRPYEEAVRFLSGTEKQTPDILKFYLCIRFFISWKVLLKFVLQKSFLFDLIYIIKTVVCTFQFYYNLSYYYFFRLCIHNTYIYVNYSFYK